MEQTKGRIFYDGLCRACSLEINHYRKQRGSEKFDFVDITQATFNAQAEGLDPFRVHKFMHVRDVEGHLREGVDAFVVIWQQLPRYHFLARLSKNDVVRFFLQLGYKFFVVIRPYLPRKKSDCASSPYCEVSK